MLRENISLKEFTTMRTGGNARYFFCVRNLKELKEAVLFAKERRLPFFVLGGGSNVIISDDGFNGVVIKIEIDGIVFKETGNNKVVVEVGAGVKWDKFVKEAVSMNLYGAENLSGIPGTVGAAPVQNIGAYGVEVKDIISFVEVLDTETMSVSRISNKECLFDYRCSVFKTVGRKFIILSVSFELEKTGVLKTDYTDVNKCFSELLSKKDTIQELSVFREAIISIRKSKLPDIKDIGSVGSFFKNPIITNAQLQELLKIYPGIKYFFIRNCCVKLSAAWLLDNIGKWKGVCKDDVCVYEKHSLVLINKGRASTSEILNFAREIQNDVKEKTKVVLEFEVNLI